MRDGWELDAAAKREVRDTMRDGGRDDQGLWQSPDGGVVLGTRRDLPPPLRPPLTHVDKLTMANSVEARVPFLNHWIAGREPAAA